MKIISGGNMYVVDTSFNVSLLKEWLPMEYTAAKVDDVFRDSTEEAFTFVVIKSDLYAWRETNEKAIALGAEHTIVWHFFDTSVRRWQLCLAPEH